MTLRKTVSLRSFKLRLVLCLSGAALIGGSVYAWRSVPPQQTVYVHDASGEPVTAALRGSTVADALQKAGLTVTSQDQVTPDLNAPLSDDLHIYVRRAVAVTVAADGKELHVTTPAKHVGDVLSALGVPVGDTDRVDPSVTAPVESEMTITVVRVRQEEVAQNEEIPFTVQRQEDRNMAEGETRVIEAGQPGRKRITYRRVYENGELVKDEKIGEEIVDEPSPQLVAYGTMGVVSRGGTQYRFARELDMRATAYAIGDGMTPGTHTALGLPAKRGVVAVDPRVIPLGTRLYIEGYGPAIAADTGGAIKGNRIDLCVDSVSEANAYGVQTVHVYILNTR